MNDVAAAVFRQYGAVRFASQPAKGNRGAGDLSFTSGCVVVPVDSYPPPAGAYYQRPVRPAIYVSSTSIRFGGRSGDRR